MRIAWSCYPRNIGLGIAAQVFVYVGTIILYLCNWFFTQRVVRAQHPRLGWSAPYRIIHRVSIVLLIIALLMIVVSSIQQFFTLDTTILRVDHNFQLAAFTYFAIFTLAPFVLLFVSFVIPRKGTEKFGAGRLRNAITVLFIGSLILAIGQCFRSVTAWLPQIPLRNAQGQPNPVPWYLTRACFYVFNFLTEILVVMLYAIMRVDLRFYVPDGAKKPGDYRAWRESQFNVDVLGSEKNLKRSSGTTHSTHSMTSNGTLHEYESSVFEDTHTLADSLRFNGSVMEIDNKTGNWKVKRQSTGASLKSRSSFRASNRSQASLWDPIRNSTATTEGAPPVPSIPQDWLLRESQIRLASASVASIASLKAYERHRTSRSTHLREPHTPPLPSPTLSSRSDAFDKAINDLLGNPAPPDYNLVAPLPPKRSYQSLRSLATPKQHVHTPSYASASAAMMVPVPKREHTPGFPPSEEIPFKAMLNPTSPTSTPSTYTTANDDLPAKRDYAAEAAAPSSPTVPALADSSKASSTLRRDASSAYSVQETGGTPRATSLSVQSNEGDRKRFSFEASSLRRSSFDEGVGGPGLFARGS